MAAKHASTKKIRYGLIQLEPTSRCNLRCTTCLRSSHARQWLERDFPPALFSTLHDVLQRTSTLHLQGWGESLLADELHEYITAAKQAGCTVSFTSNGFFMDEPLAEKLISSGMDGVTFSMAGALAATHDGLRGRNSFARLQKSIATLVATKKSLQTRKPLLAVSYLLTPQTIKELPKAVSWCAKNKVNALVGVHLTHAANDIQQALQIFAHNKKRYQTSIRLANLLAVVRRIRLQLPAFSPSLTPVCDKNPIQNLSISAAGMVAPCVFLNGPTANPVKWRGNNRQNSSFRLGNLQETPLDEIWQQNSYRQFRDRFKTRLHIYQKALASVGYDMDGIEQLESAREKIQKAFLKNPPPDPCLGCSKLNGY